MLILFHPVDPVSGKCSVEGDNSESLIDIDTSEVLFNGRVIQELDIFGVAMTHGRSNARAGSLRVALSYSYSETRCTRAKLPGERFSG